MADKGRKISLGREGGARGANSSLVVWWARCCSVVGSILLCGEFSGRGDFFPWS